jgi:hypothetical protein
MKYQSDNDITQVHNKINYLKNKVKKYNCKFTVLTHNTALFDKVWDGWLGIYEKACSYD